MKRVNTQGDQLAEKGVLVVGSDDLVISVIACLLLANTKVYYLSDSLFAVGKLDQYLTEMVETPSSATSLRANLSVLAKCERVPEVDMSIVVTREDLEEKRRWICLLEKQTAPETPIAVNTESFTLQELRSFSTVPERIVGLNWAYPAHTTSFLELITDECTSTGMTENIVQMARCAWKKDPCISAAGFSVRARLMMALFREALYLVEHGYATVESIDRACRNDAGFYLPFAGNFRYMDLMGTYAYGLVMKDLNAELSAEQDIPDFLKQFIADGRVGMAAKNGFYAYQDGDDVKWQAVFDAFKMEIRELSLKYLTEREKLYC